MISEKEICELLSSMLPEGRTNRCFESDSEIIQMNGTQCLFTTDEFSAEDLFRESDPYRLGWNIAAGAISDILACGGTPLFYAHALTVGEGWDRDFLIRFGMGVRDVLNQTGARFIGGDCGRSPHWRCTASVIGSCDGPPVTRRGATPGDLIYCSGQIGAGNLEAALRLYGGDPSVGRAYSRAGAESCKQRLASTLAPPNVAGFTTPFCLRGKESAVMKPFASACIDTSDGLWNAVDTLANLNGCGYRINHLPYAPLALEYCQRTSLPKPLLFLGECGEYELLVTLKPEREMLFLAEAQKSRCHFHRLGTMTSGEKTLQEEGQTIHLESLQIHARDYETPQHYLHALGCWLTEQLALSRQCQLERES